MHMIREKYMLSKFKTMKKKIFYEIFQADVHRKKVRAANKRETVKKKEGERKREKKAHVKQMFVYGIMKVDKNSIIVENEV